MKKLTHKLKPLLRLFRIGIVIDWQTISAALFLRYETTIKEISAISKMNSVLMKWKLFSFHIILQGISNAGNSCCNTLCYIRLNLFKN